MQKSAHFRVDPKLLHDLDESYTNSEKALKELIDNARDAEATEVHVTVPNILTDAPIIVQDNGSSMKTAEKASKCSCRPCPPNSSITSKPPTPTSSTSPKPASASR